MDTYIRTKQLDMDLKKLEFEVRQIAYTAIHKYINKLPSREIDWHGSITAMLDPWYNIFENDTPEVQRLLGEVRTMFLENFKVIEPLGIHCWTNITRKGNHLKWHGHWAPEDRSWHGYFALKAEPSTTTYNIPGEPDLVVVNNKNNQLLISPSDGDRHCVSPWTEEWERISIAFDVVPLSRIKGSKVFSPFLSPNDNEEGGAGPPRSPVSDSRDECVQKGCAENSQENA
jgi:hypothetical protein